MTEDVKRPTHLKSYELMAELERRYDGPIPERDLARVKRLAMQEVTDWYAERKDTQWVA